MAKITILGCGPSVGIPAVGGPEGQGEWGSCNPENPKNIRSRCSVYVESNDVKVLIDSSPDLRWQFINNGITDIDAVLYTHTHADHIHGIEDLRKICLTHQRPIDIYGSSQTLETIKSRFEYVFRPPPGDRPLYLLHVSPHEINDVFQIKETEIRAIEITHDPYTHTVGYRIGDIAYFPDVADFPDKALSKLTNLELLIIDAYREKPHFSHLHLDKTLEWIDKIAPKQAVLTNLSSDFDYDALKSRLPKHVQPAYDGLKLAL